MVDKNGELLVKAYHPSLLVEMDIPSQDYWFFLNMSRLHLKYGREEVRVAFSACIFK